MTRPNRNPNRKPNRNPLLAFWLGVFIISAFLLPPSSFILVSAQTAEPYAWRAATHPPQTAKMQIWRGDTVPLAPDWGASDTNGWTFTAWWSTNNTDWWSKSLAADPAPTLAGDPFLWTPDMDVGAARYTLFIRAANTNGASYRANAQITMLDSPGTDPASLPLPVTAIDFSLVSTLNAPWLLPDATNALAAALQPLGPRIASLESRTNIWDYASTLPDLWSRFGSHVDDILTNPHSVRADQIGAATTQQLAAAVAPLASTQQLAAAISAINMPVQSINAKTGAVVLAAADVGAVSASGDFSVALSDGVTAFAVSTAVGERIALDSFDQTLHLYRDGTVKLWDYEDGRGVREFSLFDVPTYADITAAPEWQVYTNIAATCTVTNAYERPVRIYGDGSATGTISFAALREPLPVYVEASGFPGIEWPGAYTVGGGFWQTNMVNVFLVWQSSSNIFVNPVTARPL